MDMGEERVERRGESRAAKANRAKADAANPGQAGRFTTRLAVHMALIASPSVHRGIERVEVPVFLGLIREQNAVDEVEAVGDVFHVGGALAVLGLPALHYGL